MKHPSKKMLSVVALILATVCVSSSVARKQGDATGQDKHVFVPFSDAFKPNGWDAQVRGGQVIGMTMIRKDGSRKALKQQTKPTCATSCPAGQRSLVGRTKWN